MASASESPPEWVHVAQALTNTHLDTSHASKDASAAAATRQRPNLLSLPDPVLLLVIAYIDGEWEDGELSKIWLNKRFASLILRYCSEEVTIYHASHCASYAAYLRRHPEMAGVCRMIHLAGSHDFTAQAALMPGILHVCRNLRKLSIIGEGYELWPHMEDAIVAHPVLEDLSLVLEVESLAELLASEQSTTLPDTLRSLRLESQTPRNQLLLSDAHSEPIRADGLQTLRCVGLFMEQPELLAARLVNLPPLRALELYGLSNCDAACCQSIVRQSRDSLEMLTFAFRCTKELARSRGEQGEAESAETDATSDVVDHMAQDRWLDEVIDELSSLRILELANTSSRVRALSLEKLQRLPANLLLISLHDALETDGTRYLSMLLSNPHLRYAKFNLPQVPAGSKEVIERIKRDRGIRNLKGWREDPDLSHLDSFDRFLGRFDEN